MGKIIELPLMFDPEDIIARKGLGFEPDFQIFTSGIEADRENPRLVHMIGSSTEKDLQGDSMSLLALNDMTKASSNMTIWLNHDYSLPDSIFGSVLGSPSIFHQDGVADLRLSVDVEMDNPQAARVKRYIDNGRKLGCSIGCMVTKYEVPEQGEGEDWFQQSIIIHGVYVVEYSVVGIPCNQRSWVENAVRGVFQRTFNPSLAPAMKSLWPSAYKKAVKTLPQERREELDQIPSRSRSDARLEWLAEKKLFSFSQGTVIKEFQPDEVRALLKTGGIADVQEDVQPEITSDVQPEEVKEVFDVQTENIDETDVVKGVCGSTSWPLNTTASWDKGSAHKNLLEWAGGKESFSAAKFKKVHFRYEGDGTQISDFHFPFCNVSDGKVEAIWHAIEAAAGALDGARGGANTEGDTAGMKSRIASYYRKAGKTPPWEGGDDGKSLDDAEVVTKDAQPELQQVVSEDVSESVVPELAEKEQEVVQEVVTPDIQKETTPEVHDAPSVAVELPAHTLALLTSYNTLAKSLGLVEVAPDKLEAAQHLATLQKAAETPSPDMQRLQAIHDMVVAMTMGQVCGGSGYENDDHDADDMESGSTVSNGPLAVSYDVAHNMSLMSKAIERYHAATVDLFDVKKEAEITKRELAAAREEISTLATEVMKAVDTIAALKDMPLGNPAHHSRTVHDATTVTREELLQVQQSKQADLIAADSLPAALELTEIRKKQMKGGQYMRYRYWPEGVGGTVKEGVRPDLTSDQISMMQFSDIYAYRDGKSAEVPYLGA